MLVEEKKKTKIATRGERWKKIKWNPEQGP
jgi:hypothetical protein